MFSIEQLTERLSGSARVHNNGVGVSVYHQGKVHWIGANGYDRRSRVGVSCIAKSLTASLLAVAESEGKVGLASEVARYFYSKGMGLEVQSHIERLKVVQLLNHTHGIDHARIGSLLKIRTSASDVDALLETLEPRDLLAEPGEVFNFSNVGPFIVAAILERAYGTTYSALLREKVLMPSGASEVGESSLYCASTGAGLELTTDQILQCFISHLQPSRKTGDVASCLEKLREASAVDIPKWPPSGDAICPGWIRIGGGYGQWGGGEGGSAAVRIYPNEGFAVAVASSDIKVARFTISALLDELDIRVSAGRRPRKLAEDELRTKDLEPYVGRYMNATLEARIERMPGERLQMTLSGPIDDIGTNSNMTRSMAFAAATGDTFFPLQVATSTTSMLRFSNMRHGIGYGCLRLPHQVLTRRH